MIFIADFGLQCNNDIKGVRLLRRHKLVVYVHIIDTTVDISKVHHLNETFSISLIRSITLVTVIKIVMI